MGALRVIAVWMVMLAIGCQEGTLESGDHDAMPTTDADVEIDGSDSAHPDTGMPRPHHDAGPPEGSWINRTGNLAGMSSECGNVSALAAKPDADVIFLTVAQHGVWATTNGGESWSPRGTGGSSATITNRGVTFVFDPANPDVMWEAGIYNGNGIYRSDNAGTSFQALGDAHHNDTVSIDFTDPARATLLAGGHEQAQTVYRSTNGGSTWTNVGASLPAGTNHSSNVHVIDRMQHLVGCSGWLTATNGIFRTDNGGESWTQVSEDGGRSEPLAHSDGTLYWPSPNGGLVRSDDDGKTWSERLGVGDIGGVHPIELPDGRIATTGPRGIVVSDDRGQSWQVVTTTLPYDPTGLSYSAARRAFYIFHFSCDPATAVPDDAVMSYAFDHEAQ